MAIDKSVSLRVIAQIRDYEREIAKLDPVMQKEARIAGRTLSRELIKEQVRAAKAATDSARKIADANIRENKRATAEAAKAARQQRSLNRAVFNDAVDAQLASAAKRVKAEKAAAAETRLAWKASLAGVGAGFLAGAAAVVVWNKEIQEARTAQVRLSDATGTSRRTIAGLEESFRSVGADASQVTDQLQDFNEKLFDFGQGGGAAAEAFAGLGIDMEAVRTGAIGSDEALRMVLQRLPLLTDEVTKAAFSQQLFSDRGLDVTNAMENLDIDAATAQAERFGRVVNDEAAAATKAWNEDLALLTGAMNGVKVEVVDFIAPAERVEDLLVGLVAVSAGVTESFKLLRNSIRLSSEGLGRWALGEDLERTVGIAAATRQAAAAFLEAREEAEGLADAGLDVAFSMDEMASALGLGSVQAERASKATGDLEKKQRAAAASAKAQAAALEELIIVGFAAGDDLLSAEEKILNARDMQLAKIEELRIKAGATAEATANAEIAAAEVSRRAWRDNLDLIEQRREEAADAAARAADQAKNELREAYDVLGETASQFERDRIAGWGAIRDAALDTFNQSLNLVAQLGRQQEAAHAAEARSRIANAEEAARAIEELQQERIESREEAAQSIGAIEREAARDIKRIQKDRGKTAKQVANEIARVERQSARKIRGIQKNSTDFELQQQALVLAAQQRRQEKLAEREARLALRGHNIATGVAVGQAAVQAPLNALALTPAFVPVAGPLAPAAANAAALAQLTLQLAAIKSAPKPQFHQGGLVQPVLTAGPDAITTVQRPGEFNSTPGAVANAGGADAMRAFERGPSQQGQTTNFFMNDRLVDTYTERALSINGKARKRVRRQVVAGALVGLARVY